ncbi:DUF2357 domain-containing protein [Roseiflexus sp.]|uniref:DUF2357 domain-containing protein n=1 Tax=Roseiflexus sp. TaxID=2562120 RepID=UPI0021DCAAEF|nr:DUF2357 domain-containing protein [Roseiflexus sp.]GIW02727.1 MAG: hypothetical protein KatS3mg058_4130 [Roseiflexus sp.]
MTFSLDIELSLAEDSALPVVTEQQPVEFVCLPPGEAALVLTVDGMALTPFLRPGDARWRWVWNPGASVGTHTLRLTVHINGEAFGEWQWRLSVAPRKIDSERYVAILEDVERVAPPLVRSLAGAARDARLAGRSDLPRLWFDDATVLFGSSFEPFEQTVRRILAHPRSLLRREEEHVPLGQARELSVAAVQRAVQGDVEAAPSDAAPQVQRLLRPEGGALPRTIVQDLSRDTHDTAEHRLLKRTLELLRGRARRCADRAQREVARLDAAAPASSRAARARAIAARCDQCAQRIAGLLGAPFFEQVTALRHVPAVTPLIRRDPAYRRVYRMWRALHQGVVVDPGAPFDLPVVDLPLLYERWCVLQVVQALLNLGIEVYSCSLLLPPSDDADAWSFNFRRDEPLLVAMWSGWTLRLRYQPWYRPAPGSCNDETLVSLDCHTRIPDIAIEMVRPDHPPGVIVLDAKYRLDADGRGVPADALAEAYAYAGAIGIAGAPAVAAAFILYPGTGVAERYPGGAGAIPLLPGAVGTLEGVLAREMILKCGTFQEQRVFATS